jgi:putative spermidine/putrescine transport system ATP-binding protein
MGNNMSFLVLEGLTKRYGTQTVVDSLDLSIEKGEFISLLGPSGCGKTTTLQMIAGFAEPSAGKIFLDGANLTTVKPNKRELGIVFQSYALFPHCTAAENVAFGLQMRRVPKDECERRVAEMLELVGLSGLADRYPRRMSGGQQQRVALARALVIKPAVLLLDEPLSNLDAKLREEMQIELRSIQRTLGTTTLLVTHDQSEAMALSNRIVLMNEGRVEQVGQPEDVYACPASLFVASFLGKSNIFLGQVVELGVDHALLIDDELLCMAATTPVGEVRVQVRPERIKISLHGSSGLKGRMISRVFQGASWMYHVQTTAGIAVVISSNDGTAMAPEGAQVRLLWRPEDMIISNGNRT